MMDYTSIQAEVCSKSLLTTHCVITPQYFKLTYKTHKHEFCSY